MKYFEVTEPLYALLKAEKEEIAIDKYLEQVGTVEDLEVTEVSRDYALAVTSRALAENRKPIPIKEILSDFNNDAVVILVIDGSIL